MTEKQTTKKNLGRAVALLATLGAFAGLTSLPAWAEDWTISVNVSDTTPPACTDPVTPPSWNPDPIVTYSFTNEVDLYTAPGLVPFSVNLGLEQGFDDCNFFAINPSGEIEASVTGLDAELSMEELDCPSSSPCDAGLLYTNNSTLSGTIDAALVSSVGTKSGTLTVVWTPAG